MLRRYLLIIAHLLPELYYKLVEPPALNAPCVWTGVLFTVEAKQAARLFQSGSIIQEFSPPITAGEHRVRQPRLRSLGEC